MYEPLLPVLTEPLPLFSKALHTCKNWSNKYTLCVLIYTIHCNGDSWECDPYKRPKIIFIKPRSHNVSQKSFWGYICMNTVCTFVNRSAKTLLLWLLLSATVRCYPNLSAFYIWNLHIWKDFRSGFYCNEAVDCCWVPLVPLCSSPSGLLQQALTIFPLLGLSCQASIACPLQLLWYSPHKFSQIFSRVLIYIVFGVTLFYSTEIGRTWPIRQPSSA